LAPPTRKTQSTTPGHKTDIRIGICRGIGLSRDDTATHCGVSVPTVDLRKNEPVTQEWEEWAAGVAKTFKLETKEHFEELMRKRVGRSMDVIDRALDNDDINTALKGVDRVLDRAYGKATQKVETTSDITERVIHQIPEDTLRRLEEFVAATQPKRIAAEIIDVQQVEGEEESWDTLEDQ
jgi:hypothetical protein